MVRRRDSGRPKGFERRLGSRRGAQADSAGEHDHDLQRVRDRDRDEQRVHDTVEPASQGLQLGAEEELAHDEGDEQKSERAVYGELLAWGGQRGRAGRLTMRRLEVRTFSRSSIFRAP